MVCLGDVDLATAQRDISTDWIAAYRKYFHVDSPVMHGSSFDFSSFAGSFLVRRFLQTVDMGLTKERVKPGMMGA